MDESIQLDIPNFKLGKEIGRGGMAKVFLGEQMQPKRKVAIKIVSPQGNDPKILNDLKKEGDTVAQFSHPNIVTVYSCGVQNNYYFLAMEILSGGDLKSRIKSGRLSELDAFRICRDVARALEHAHKRGTLHRDIKPENILFHEDGQAVLVDFGIAKAQNTVSEFTRAGSVVGTPHYMSPERALGKDIDERSDIYALGVVLYEMLTGSKVYDAADTFAVSYAHVHEPIPDLPGNKARFQPMLNKLLAKSPDDRFQNATQLISQLDKYIARLKPVSDTTQSFIPIPDHTGNMPTKVSSSGNRRMQLIGVGALLIVAAAGATYWVQNRPATLDLNTEELTVTQKVEMSDKLNAANSQFRLENLAVAEQLYTQILTDYDCTQEEARSRLKIMNKAKHDEIVTACDR